MRVCAGFLGDFSGLHQVLRQRLVLLRRLAQVGDPGRLGRCQGYGGGSAE